MVSSGMVIGGVTLLVALGGLLIKPRDIKWVSQLERPNWLTFEPFIPVIWTVVFTCGAVSAYMVWEKASGSLNAWLLMGLYLALEVITVSYAPLTLRSRSLTIGTIVGVTGAILSILLALFVLPISGWAAVLLLPYVLWSPVGSYTTWEMIRLNPSAE
jgi:tryptophan-rich sensory protein